MFSVFVCSLAASCKHICGLAKMWYLNNNCYTAQDQKLWTENSSFACFVIVLTGNKFQHTKAYTSAIVC